MSASLASAMMNAREDGLALISASFASRDFIGGASGVYLREGFPERTGGLLETNLLFGPELEFEVLFDAGPGDDRRHAEADAVDAVGALDQGRYRQQRGFVEQN